VTSRILVSINKNNYNLKVVVDIIGKNLLYIFNPWQMHSVLGSGHYFVIPPKHHLISAEVIPNDIEDLCIFLILFTCLMATCMSAFINR